MTSQRIPNLQVHPANNTCRSCSEKVGATVIGKILEDTNDSEEPEVIVRSRGNGWEEERIVADTN